ncbi:MAG TPA: HD domain-containing phosphohydrolase [Thermoleophilaceae bacterium]
MRTRLGGLRARRRILAGLALVWALYASSLALELHGATIDSLENVAYYGLLFAAAAICAVRAIGQRRERLAWAVLAVGLLAWALADVYFAVATSSSLPSLADAGWLAIYPASYIAIVLLMRARAIRTDRGLWLDGLLGACAVFALGAALVFQPIADVSVGPDGAIAINLAYALGDTLLLAFVVAAIALMGWRPDRTWLLLGIGLAINAIGDCWYLYLVASGSYSEGMLIDAIWPASTLIVASAAWARGGARPARPRLEGWRVFAVPATFMLTALAVLAIDHFHRVSDLSIVFASTAIVLGTARMTMIFRQNLAVLAGSREEAVTDALTGLRNRRALLADLETELASATPDEPRALILFDLDGFKDYNDSFGHLAGDELLARLGRQLKDAVAPRGISYRLGGDEFCVLLRPGPAGTAPLAAAAATALREQGDGFVIQSSYGQVLVPLEAHEVSAALQLADQRMYAHKHGGRHAAGRQSTDVLLSTLREREPELHDHLEGVAHLAAAVAAALGMSKLEQSNVARAAELHDVGKIAIPDAILRKPGPLDAEEWDFMRRHTIIGERILMSAPALRDVATLVRASHERWDGQGYPDGVAGAEIPLGARIVSVCDAYDAMIADRPYRAGMQPSEALGELRACAGAQFDPDVVEIFGVVVAREGELKRA